jgi:hypothetical protein
MQTDKQFGVRHERDSHESAMPDTSRQTALGLDMSDIPQPPLHAAASGSSNCDATDDQSAQ